MNDIFCCATRLVCPLSSMWLQTNIIRNALALPDGDIIISSKLLPHWVPQIFVYTLVEWFACSRGFLRAVRKWTWWQYSDPCAHGLRMLSTSHLQMEHLRGSILMVSWCKLVLDGVSPLPAARDSQLWCRARVQTVNGFNRSIWNNSTAGAARTQSEGVIVWGRWGMSSQVRMCELSATGSINFSFF